MHRITALSVLLFLAALVFSVPARAAEQSALSAVRQTNEAVLALLKRKAKAGSAEEKRLAEEIKGKVEHFLDVDELGKRALADHWDGLTEAQRSEYLKLLRQLVQASYLRVMRDNADFEVRYLGETTKGDKHVVNTEVHTKRKGRTEVVSVDYVLEKEGGEWRAVDVITDSVGLIENYRAQFNKIIAEKGFSTLLEKLRKKAEKSEGEG